jgi:N,N-dimethylglycine/sarcosine catabolism electron transfer flavoprotein subunit beta
MTLAIAVLVSIGRHPASGRPRRADRDARALDLALRLSPAAKPQVIHAGDPREPALRDYLGMGIDSLTVLDLPSGADPIPALAEHLKKLRPQLVLAGSGAEAGECSGMVPYALAAALDAAIVADIADIALAGDRLELLQALPRGRRRRLSAALPAVVTVGSAAPPARPFAFGPASRGCIDIVPAASAADTERAAWQLRPARARPKRLKVATGGSAAERLRAATEIAAGRGRLLVDPSPADAARAILDYLRDEGIVRS